MGCRPTTVLIQPNVSVDLSSCFGSQNPVDYKLLNFIVIISSSKTNQAIFSEIIFNTTQGLGRVNVTYAKNSLRLFIANTNNLPSGVKTFTTELKDNPRLSVLVTFPATEGKAVQFQFGYAQVASGTITAKGEAIGQLSLPFPGSIPNLTATILPTPDGKQVFELLFSVTTENESTVEGIHNTFHCAATDTSPMFNVRCSRDYKQYCVPFASLICAPGFSLRDKILALGEGENFLQYMVARYIISGLLNGCFSVDALRQRYTESFLKAVQDSQYKDFLPILETNPKFATYFKC